jgi:AcrR family transcriptional regulator
LVTPEEEADVTARRAKGQEREALVVEAAAQAIAERGLANVRMADVAEIAGMSVGHVSYYFPSKIELLMRAITANEERHWTAVEARMLRIRDPWKRLDTLLDTAASLGPHDPGWVLWFQLWLESALDADVARGHDELDARWRRILADVIRYGVAQGAFTSTDPDEDALVLSCIVDGLSIQVTLESPVVTRRRMMKLLKASARARLAAD